MNVRVSGSGAWFATLEPELKNTIKALRKPIPFLRFIAQALRRGMHCELPFIQERADYWKNINQ